MILNILLWIVLVQYVLTSVAVAGIKVTEAKGNGEDYLWIAFLLAFFAWPALVVGAYVLRQIDLEG